MKHYITQLCRDIDLIYLSIEENYASNPYEDLIDCTENTLTSYQTKKKLKLSEITGFHKTDFPPSHLLSVTQKELLGEKLESLLWVCNFVITVPIVFTYSERYSFIREIWNNQYTINKGGLFVIEYYTYHKHQ
ncbi:MAG: hypothetical protein ACPG6V_03605 [Flavobacteriales bacterium]